MFNGRGPCKAYTLKIYDRALQRIALYIDLRFLVTLKAGLFSASSKTLWFTFETSFYIHCVYDCYSFS